MLNLNYKKPSTFQLLPLVGNTEILSCVAYRNYVVCGYVIVVGNIIVIKKLIYKIIY